MIAFIQALGVIGYCGLLVFAYPVKLYLKTKKYEQS